jgi:hypothetical protein
MPSLGRIFAWAAGTVADGHGKALLTQDTARRVLDRCRDTSHSLSLSLSIPLFSLYHVLLLSLSLSLSVFISLSIRSDK